MVRMDKEFYRKTMWVIFFVLLGYNVGTVVDYHDDRVLVDYVNNVIAECNNKTISSKVLNDDPYPNLNSSWVKWAGEFNG